MHAIINGILLQYQKMRVNDQVVIEIILIYMQDSCSDQLYRLLPVYSWLKLCRNLKPFLHHNHKYSNHTKCNELMLPYTVKLSSGKTFAVFQPITKVFPLNHLLCTVHDGHGLMYCKSFPVNSVFSKNQSPYSLNYLN